MRSSRGSLKLNSRIDETAQSVLSRWAKGKAVVSLESLGRFRANTRNAKGLYAEV
jgi:hypothetical protein